MALLKKILSVLVFIPLHQGSLVGARSGFQVRGAPTRSVRRLVGKASKHQDHGQPTQVPEPTSVPLDGITSSPIIAPAPTTGAQDTNAPTSSPLAVPTDVASSPLPGPVATISHVRALLPFSVAVEGKLQNTNDVVVVMKQFLFSKLSESFESLEWILLDASSSHSDEDENRKLQEEYEVVFSSGEAIFLDHEGIPTVEEVQRAQREALELLTPLGEFVEGQGFDDWVITLINVHEVDPDGVAASEEESGMDQENASVDDSTNLKKDNIFIQDKEDEKNRTALITVLALVAAMVCMASGLFALRRIIGKEKPDSFSGRGLAVNPPGVAETTTTASTPPPLSPTPRANNETTVASKMHSNWAHVFRLSTDGIDDLEDADLSTSTPNSASEKRELHLLTVPVLEQTETVVLQAPGVAHCNRNRQDESSTCSSDDSSSISSSGSHCDYIRNRSYDLPPVREEKQEEQEEEYGDRTTALVNDHHPHEVFPSTMQYYPPHPYSNMLGPDNDESSEEIELSDSVYYV